MSIRLDHGEDTLGEIHEINVTPFIDVILVLLIIFMVAAPLATVDVPVNLPSASGEPPALPIRTSTRPKCCTAAAIRAVAWSGSRTSAGQNRAVRPSAALRSLVSPVSGCD